jgi:Cys-rich repeat protein
MRTNVSSLADAPALLAVLCLALACTLGGCGSTEADGRGDGPIDLSGAPNGDSGIEDAGIEEGEDAAQQDATTAPDTADAREPDAAEPPDVDAAGDGEDDDAQTSDVVDPPDVPEPPDAVDPPDTDLPDADAPCTSNRDCLGGELCRDGLCVPFCTSDADCADGQRCDAGECVAIADPCAPAGGAYCEDDAVVVCGADGQIAARLPCREGERCEDATCVRGGCTPDDNRCLDDDPQAVLVCSEDGTILLEEACDLQQICDEGACVFPTGANLCGGDALLDRLPGLPCGDCGVTQCSGPNATECLDPGRDVCGGCSTIPAAPGDDCGECGRYVCDGVELECDDPGNNGCGFCGELEGEPGEACGECGTWACVEGGGWGGGEPGVECDDPGTNACGGCGELTGFPGQPCDGGVLACDGGTLVCREATYTSCFTAFECLAWAGRFGIDNPLAIGCDDEVGCYLKGECGTDGPAENDPFGSACREGTTCTVLPFVGGSCTGCTVGDDSTCRDGEVCEEVLFGLSTECRDPLSIFP